MSDDTRTLIDRCAVVILLGLMVGYFVVGPIYVYIMEHFVWR